MGFTFGNPAHVATTLVADCCNEWEPSPFAAEVTRPLFCDGTDAGSAASVAPEDFSTTLDLKIT